MLLPEGAIPHLQVRRASGNPVQETGDFGVPAQSFNGVVIAGEISLCENCMDFRVAGSMEGDARAFCTTFQPWNQVVPTFKIRWDRPVA